MIQEIITNLGSSNPFANIVKGVDMKRKIVIGILTTKGKRHIKKTNLTMHHMMTTIKISDQNSDHENEDSFIAFMALTSFNHS